MLKFIKKIFSFSWIKKLNKTIIEIRHIDNNGRKLLATLEAIDNIETRGVLIEKCNFTTPLPPHNTILSSQAIFTFIFKTIPVHNYVLGQQKNE